jgi:Chalcone isomerase-like
MMRAMEILRASRRWAEAVSLPAALALCLISHGASAATIEDVTFAERVDAGGTELALSGLGLLRYRVVFKAYVAALYLEPGSDPERVLEDVPKRLEIEYFWPKTSRARATSCCAAISTTRPGRASPTASPG